MAPFGRASSVLRTPGQPLEHAHLMFTKNTFVDVVDAAREEDWTALRALRRARSWDGPPQPSDLGARSAPAAMAAAAHSCEDLGFTAPAPAPSALRPTSSAGPRREPAAVATGSFVAVVRNTFVEVRDLAEEAEFGLKHRRSRSQGEVESIGSQATVESIRTAPLKAAAVGSSSTISTTGSDDAVCGSPARVTSGKPDRDTLKEQPMCGVTPAKIAQRRSSAGTPIDATPGSASTRASSTKFVPNELAEWSPNMAPVVRASCGSAGTELSSSSSDSERRRVRLNLEKILWGRLPGNCLDSDSSSSSDDSDCEEACKLVNAELAKRIEQCRNTALRLGRGRQASRT